MKKKLNRIITVLWLLVFCLNMLFISVCAATPVQIQIRTASAQGSTYNDATVFYVGEKIYLPIKFTNDNNTTVQGFACNIDFDENVLKVSDDTFASIKDSKAVLNHNTKDGIVYITWDTVSDSIEFNGDAIFVVFETKEAADNVNFTIAVTEFYSASKGKPDIDYSIVNETISAKIINEQIDDAVIELFKKLNKITVDSLEDIVAAETAWAELSASEKQYLKNNYSNEYNWLSTARSRFNELINNQKIEAIEKLLNEFKTTYKTALNLTIDKATTKHKKIVNEAITAYKTLPTSVTTRLDKDLLKKLQELSERITTLEDAKKEAKAFEETYLYLTNLSDVMLEESFTMYSGYIEESIMVYDLLPDDAKTMVDSLYKKLLKLKDKCDKIVANEEALAKIREEVNAFQQKWLKVFTLNVGNVTSYDKTAIEMVLSDYDKNLSEDAKKSLASRMETFKSLLEVIAEQEENETGDSSNDTTNNDNLDNQVIVETIVEKEPEIITETKETIVEKELKVTDTKYLNKAVSKSIWLMFGLLGVAILTLIIPAVMTIRYKKRLAIFMATNEEEEGYE